MSSQVAYVEPAVLAWARRSANLESKAAARKIQVPEQRVAEWEAGKRRPTIPELRRAAKVYNRSLGVLFLSEPPSGFDTLRDFRRLDSGESGEWSAALHAEYRRAHEQREAILEILELDGVGANQRWRIDPLPKTDSGIANAARSLLLERSPLPLPLGSRDEYSHLNFWTSALEEAGILVMTTAGGLVRTEEMRAFSLYFDEVPVIVLNGADWPRGRMFSLIHEYSHLLLHTAGLCDTTTDIRAVTPDRRLEARCNALAAEILMPKDLVLDSAIVLEHQEGEPWTLEELLLGARPFGASVESFLRRLVTLGLAPIESYQKFRESNGEVDLRGRRSGKGNFYNNKVRDLGKGYVRQVTDAHRRSLIDTTTTATYLDAKVGQIATLAKKAQLRTTRGE